MYNFLEYSNNYFIKLGILQNHYRDEINGDAKENDAVDKMINNNETVSSKYVEYKTKLIGTTTNNNNIPDPEILILFKYLTNFWRSLDFRLNNCEAELDLSWSKDCIISEISIMPWTPSNPDANPPAQ